MILFLDYDGVLHPNEAFMTKSGVVLRCDGHNLFEHAELLADLLEPYPNVKIILSTSWVWTLSFKRAKEHLPGRLQSKVTGATWHSQIDERPIWDSLTRYEQINICANSRGIKNWVAIDDNDTDWPDSKRHRLIHTNEWGGLGGTAGAMDELRAKLEGRMAE